MIEKLCLQTQVTALCTVNSELILEGCGGFLNVYSFTSNELLESFDVFNGARIHGIRYCETKQKLVAFGGKLIAVFQIESLLPTSRLKLLTKLYECDWIRDVKFINSGAFLVKLTAHNKVLIQQADDSTLKSVIEIQGDEQCILYSGKILGDHLSKLTILAGTVFGNILIWAASSIPEEKIIFHRLSGHNGVIFSVNYDAVSRTIISTSDDRSVRIWKLEGVEPKESLDLWDLFKHSKILPKYELYGHEARVWNSVVIRENPSDCGLIASLGEDSQICLWDLSSGKLFSKFEAHPGTSVWDAVWDSRRRVLISAGGDGSTRMWNASHLQETSCRQLKLPMDNHLPRLVAVTSAGYLVASQQGVVYVWNIDSTGFWEPLFEDERLGNGSVLDTDGETIIFGTRSGAVFVFVSGPGPSLKLLVTHQLEVSKIYSVHLVASEQFVACLDGGRMVLMNLHTGSSLARFILPESKQRWPSCILATQNHFLMGDREGSFHLYSTEKETPIQSFPHIHGKNGLTDVRADLIDKNLYYTGGRDGRIGLWRLNENSMEMLSITSTSLGWVARLCWVENQLLCLAFYSDRFVLWSNQEQRSLMHVPCGGGHRSWDFNVSSSHVTFLFIKDKQVYENKRLLNSVFNASLPGRCGGHSKSVCRGRFISFGEPLVLTGSEDTTMRLSRLHQRSAQSLTIVTKHVSSVRALAVRELQPGTWLCVSAGGRAQLSVGLLTVSGQGDHVHVIHRDVRSHFLRGWLRRTTNKPWVNDDGPALIPDPETRYMDVDVVERGDSHFHVIAACSDSFIRVFELSLSDNRLNLFQELSFHDCCVLQVKIVADSTGNIILLSAGTDGKIAVWNITTLEEDVALEPMGSVSVHQSGINSLDCKWVDTECMLILTGGDDNALICSKIEINCAEGSVRLLDRREQFPHAAQISGVAMIDNDFCLSVSLDQRLILWKRDDTRMTWLRTVCCDVSDIQGLDVITPDASRTLVMVYGQGIQVFQVDHSFKNIPEIVP